MSNYYLLKSLRSIVDGDKVVTPDDYRKLIYEISKNKLSEDLLNELRDMRCILNRKGNFIYPHEALMYTTDSLNDERFIDAQLNHEVYNSRRYYDDPDIKRLFEKIGVGEVVSTTTDEVTYYILMDNQSNVVQLIDSELNEINHINISAHLPRQKRYFPMGEISLVFLPLDDYFNDSESKLVEIRLSLFDGNYVAIADITTGQIVVPFIWGDAKLDTENNRIIFSNSIYSTEGEKLFPNECISNIYIAQISRTGICTATDEANHKCYVIQKDYTVTTFDEKIYEYGYYLGCIGIGSMRFEIWDNGLIKTTERVHESPIYPNGTKCALTDSYGKFIAEAPRIYQDTDSGKIIANDQYYYLSEIYNSNGKYLYNIHDKRCEFINYAYCKFQRIEKFYNDTRYYGLGDRRSYDIIFPIICEEIDLLFDGGPFRFKINGKYGLIDQNGNPTMPPIYDYIKCSGKCIYSITGHIIEEENGKKKIIGGRRRLLDLNGQERIDIDFDGIKSNPKNGKIIAKRTSDGLCGVYDENLNIIVPFVYDLISEDEPYYRVLSGHKKGLLNHQGDVLVPPEFDHIYTRKTINRLVRVKVDNTWYFYDITEQKVDSPSLEFDKIRDFENGFAMCKKDGKWGYIDESYNVCIPPQFESAGDFDSKGIARVILNGENILIDGSGNKVGEWYDDPDFFEGSIYDSAYYDRESWYAMTDGQEGEYPEQNHNDDDDF